LVCGFAHGQTAAAAGEIVAFEAMASERGAIAALVFEASYQVPGDLAETMALVLPPAQGS
jgi:hypothetical protein